MKESKPVVKIYMTPGIGTYYIKDGMVHNLGAMTCPKCGIGYIRPIPIDIGTAALLRTHGKWRCDGCGYIEKDQEKDPISQAAKLTKEKERGASR